jgi:hypothetical protein
MTDQNQPPVPPQGSTPPTPPPPPAPQYQAAPQYSATPPAGGGYQGQPAAVPGRGLGIAGLIVSIAGFFIFWIIGPIAGLIMSIIARNQSKKAGVENTPAKAGIIVGIIGLVLHIIGLIIVIVIAVAAGGALIEACQQLGPGEHYVDGVNYTCS